MLKECALTAAPGGSANLVDGLPGIQKMWVVGSGQAMEIWHVWCMTGCVRRNRWAPVTGLAMGSIKEGACIDGVSSDA